MHRLTSHHVPRRHAEWKEISQHVPSSHAVYVVFRHYENLCVFLFQTFYRPGDYIIRQGARGDTFFIISKGQVSGEIVTLVIQQLD